MRGTGTVLGLALLAATAAATAGSIKKWVDDQGRVHFGDAPPPSAGSVVVSSESDYRPAPRGDSPEGLRPGERRMLERIEQEEREFIQARDRSAKDAAERSASDAKAKSSRKRSATTTAPW